MEVIGKIKVIQQVVEKGSFKSRNIVISTDEQYPQDISIQFVQDKCDILNNYNSGQEVKISINLRGREWINPQGEAVYFNTIQGWRIEKVVNDKHPVQAPHPTHPTPSEVKADNSIDNDLPF